jgi:hypothetical protein
MCGLGLKGSGGSDQEAETKKVISNSVRNSSLSRALFLSDTNDPLSSARDWNSPSVYCPTQKENFMPEGRYIERPRKLIAERTRAADS